jgi:hypothetical protein
MTAETQGRAPVAADDRGVGLAMFLVFSVAIRY